MTEDLTYSGDVSQGNFLQHPKTGYLGSSRISSPSLLWNVPVKWGKLERVLAYSSIAPHEMALQLFSVFRLLSMIPQVLDFHFWSSACLAWITPSTVIYIFPSLLPFMSKGMQAFYDFVMAMVHLHEKEMKDFRRMFSKAQKARRREIPIKDLHVLRAFRNLAFNFLGSGVSIALLSFFSSFHSIV